MMNSSNSISSTGWPERFGRLARLLSLLALALALASNPELRAQDAVPFTYYTNQNAITITGYVGPGGAVTVPAIIDGLPVTGIEDAFFERSDLRQITLPDSISYIGSGAFYGCTSLTNVTLPDSLTSIGYEAFWGCAGLTQITFPDSLKSIGDWAFYGCSSLTQVSLPSSFTFLGEWAFSGCTGLKAFEVDPLNPAFSSRDGVLFDKEQTYLILCPAGKAGPYIVPENVASIDDGAFSGCTGLTDITLPQGLASIGVFAFSGCGGLTEITLPSSLATIGLTAFVDCWNLRFAKFLGNEPEIEWGGGVFIPALPFGLTVLHLPGATGWTDRFGGAIWDSAPTALWLPTIGQPTAAGGLPGGSLEFAVEWTPQRQIAIDACTDLAHPDWQPVGTVTLDAAGTGQFTDPDSAVAPSRFYRLRVP